MKEEVVERVLSLNGTIAEDSWFDDDVTPAQFKEKLNAGSGDITVWINSPGGDCVAAAQIYNMLEEYPGKVTVKIDGLAASAASVIAMAGNEVHMSPVSMMMIHNPATVAWGDHGDMQKAMELLDSVKESIINAYVLKTGMSRAKLSHLMDAETGMDANKAVEFGFADNILFTEQKSEREENIIADSVMSIKDLMEKRAKVWETAKNFVDTHENENGVLSAEDTATYERMEAEIEDLTKAIDRQTKAEQREQELNKPVNSPLTGKPYSGRQDEEKTGRASDEYRKAMLTAMRSNFRQVSNVFQEGVDADGGYLVPEEYDRRLIDVLGEENVMRGLATRITTSGQHKINNLDAFKLHVAIKATEELLYDNAFNLENYIITQFGKALGNAEEDAFLNGDGTGKPTGLFDATNGGHLLNTLTAALKSDDMLDLVYGLKRPYRRNASFLMNDATLASLRKLKDNNGAYIWQPSYQAGEPDRVLGYAVNASAYAPTDAIAFGDFSYYNIGDRGSRSFAELRELFAGNGMIGYVAKERVDGKLILPEAVQIMKLKEAAV